MYRSQFSEAPLGSGHFHCATAMPWFYSVATDGLLQAP